MLRSSFAGKVFYYLLLRRFDDEEFNNFSKDEVLRNISISFPIINKSGTGTGPDINKGIDNIFKWPSKAANIKRNMTSIVGDNSFQKNAHRNRS